MLANGEKVILQLEKNYWQAIKDSDIERAVGLTDDPCIVAGSRGVAVVDSNSFREMIKTANWTLEEYEFTGDPVVRMISDDVGIVAYTIRERLQIGGEPVSLEAAQASTWIRRADRWLCSLHVETVTPDGH